MNKTISVTELYEAIKDIHIETLIKYLNNYRFTKFRVTSTSGRKAQYLLNSAFLSTLYTLLYIRRKIKAAENLKKEYKIAKLIKWEDFVCEN